MAASQADATVTNGNSLAVHNLSLAEQTDDASSAQSIGASSGYTTPASSAPQSQSKLEQTNGGPVRIPLAHPDPSCKPLVRPELTPEQSTKYTTVLERVSEWKEIPNTSARNSAKHAITDSERMWLTRECILRYLRATNWNTTNATQRLMDTLTWRHEYGTESLTADHVSPENETGKQVLLGYDNNARPCLYLNPGRQNTKPSERQIQHLVFMLERTVDMMDPGQDMCALLINFKNSTTSGSPSVSQGRQVLTILQGYYPERLGRALISNLPWYIATFFKLISPFIDPSTREKMIFNQDLVKYVPAGQLDKEYGGQVDFKYEHAIYWPALDKICAERRAAYRERWMKAGKNVGEYEAYLRGGEQKSLSELSTTAS